MSTKVFRLRSCFRALGRRSNISTALAILVMIAIPQSIPQNLAAQTAQVVTSLTLINANTDLPVAGFDPIPNGGMIDLAALPTVNLNIRANTSPATVGSVRFRLDATTNYRTDNTAPYAIGSESGGNYAAWTPGLGAHTVTATPYSGNNAGGTAGTPLTVSFFVTRSRINSGGPTYTDTTGRVWTPDAGFSGGTTHTVTTPIAGTVEDPLFQSERYGTFSYSLPVPNGSYAVTMHFAEIYHTSANQRVFDVSVEGQLVIDNLDIWAVVGANTALSRTVQTSVTDGVLNLSFISVIDNAKVSAIEVNPSSSTNQAPRANAGADRAITLPTNTTTLSGTATDDGLPTSSLTYSWTVAVGPAAATFSAPTALTTTVTFTTAGTYTLRLTVSDSLLIGTDDVVVTVNPVTMTNQPPIANAGADRAITLPTNTTTLSGTGSDDGLPTPALTYAWSVVTGPAAVTFSAPTALTTVATFTTAGSYTLRLAVSDSLLTGTDDVVVTVNPVPTTFVPIRINAGGQQYTDSTGQVWAADKNFSGGAAYSADIGTAISGTVDDTLYRTERWGPHSYNIPVPNGSYAITLAFAEIYWTAAGQRVFDVAIEGQTVRTGLDIVAAAGANAALNLTYERTVSDGTLNIDFVPVIDNPKVSAVQVVALSGGTNLPPVVNAGADQAITQPTNSVQLTGTASDDGLPTPPGALTYAWSVVSGPGPVSFSTQSALSTTATFVKDGTYTLRLTANDSSLISADDVVVTVLPTGSSGVFQNEIITTGLDLPTAMQFLPDGATIIAQLGGRIMLLPRGATEVNTTPFLQITNIGSGFQGLVGLVLDPDFATNNYYYVFYTRSSPNRDTVSRFTASGSTTSLATERIIWQDDVDSQVEHHGGSLNFGLDGKFYITTGEHFQADTAQSLSSYHGKILRINKDGTVPTDNPFYDGGGPNKDAIWALGLRNPYRSYMDPITGKYYIGDVGGNSLQDSSEWIHLGVRGANFGWPICEYNACTNPPYTPPLYSYPHAGRNAAVTSGFVYHGNQFPSEYVGSYFFADYAQNWIRRLTFDASGNVAGVFNFEPPNGSVDGPYGNIVYLTEGPDGALYYVDIGYDEIADTVVPGSIRRIRFVGPGNQPPTAVASATPTHGLPPLTVAFSSQGSIDPEGTPLSYSWTFGDTTTSSGANPVHTYSQSGLYTVRLSVSDGTTSTLAAPLTISVGTNPVASILSPTSGSLFRGGDTITIVGDATDAEDGALPASVFSWAIDFHHGTHVHPGVTVNGTKTTSFQIPSSGHEFDATTYYEIRLTVTDSSGLQGTKSTNIYPERVNLTFDTSPSGLNLIVDGIPIPTPFTRDTLINYQYAISAPNQTQGNTSYTFNSWSDGGAQSHTVVAPAIPQTFVASYTATPPPFTFSLNNAGNITVVRGTSAANGVTATLLTGAAATVTFSASGVPAGTSAVFSAPSCLPTCTVTLTLTTTSATPLGTSAVTVTGTSGAAVVSTAFNLTVNAPVSFAPVRINAGGPQYTDTTGQVWAADKNFAGGSAYAAAATTAISGTVEDALYRTERWGEQFSYNVTVPNGTYAVTLHFAEIYWTATNQRVFDVFAEGTRIISALDIWKSVGGNTALPITIIVPVNDGVLNLDFLASIDGAKLSALEIRLNP